MTTKNLATDASFSGFGAAMQTSWLAGAWILKNYEDRPIPNGFSVNWLPSPFVDSSIDGNINYSELIVACLPLLVWGNLSQNRTVIILSDDTSTVASLNRETTKKVAALQWLKLVLHDSVQHNF